ncbi:VOC family protein [Parendozoicomonas haliclonae]|uniref:3-demethylubiquinone-9 3-methyltransferase n=2 Tax=Parendozoicomonas haliclonae TaxID=1960125 RepID=A0A1X7ARM9_9GAMM|nr:3-demethylubiquinone-9 3-methyltransferase [Parendozoicomonas haliclonae]
MPKVRPFLMFQGGVAQDALDRYLSTFPNSEILSLEKYADETHAPKGYIKLAVFSLCGQEYMCSDSPINHDFSFTPSSSTFVEFDSQHEFDHVFNHLSNGGEILMPPGNYGFSKHFAWVNDQFGVSWQLSVAV